MLFPLVYRSVSIKATADNPTATNDTAKHTKTMYGSIPSFMAATHNDPAITPISILKASAILFLKVFIALA